MSTPRLQAKSGILYVRASLKPFARAIRAAGGVRELLHQQFDYDELFAPYFLRARPFWRHRSGLPGDTNSGPLGKKLSEYPDAVVSRHPTHRFVGSGKHVASALQRHDYQTSCFEPVGSLAQQTDFSMLLLGCQDESPGFSTAHATQHVLGLSQKHLLRYLIRWDVDSSLGPMSMTAPESPGCSLSFDKFYPYYERDGNLIRGDFLAQEYLYVPSAAQAMRTEKTILSTNPRFVDCGRWNCVTCRFRLY